MFEVTEQEQQLGLFFETIVVRSVTGSTQAGMVAGPVALGGRQRRILGIDGSAKPKETWDQVARIARSTAALIGADRPLDDGEILLDERYHAGTYGIPDQQTIAAIEPGMRTDRMLTDPVYEGRSLAGMIDLVATGDIPRNSTVLYAPGWTARDQRLLGGTRGSLIRPSPAGPGHSAASGPANAPPPQGRRQVPPRPPATSPG